ncbi:acyltransferase family protein [Qipengyuania atrilutea]|uniref:Acyltransferase n=1 Tax=Qipengyuania atrilutea TaxID=2744473 RepID=A0A850HE08_9SPHN|nr:acyltransferase [Actirhodobacter atriluteus]NVD45409.1 acyltransferase [Actirhodobacter atriluteus]
MAKAVESGTTVSQAHSTTAVGTASTDKKSRSLAIDRARGLGIALVVWGHLATAATPGLPTWFYISVSVIYSFHMPLFMYLSGFVFFLSRSHERFWEHPAKQVWNRFDRLMVPCIAFALITVTGKVLLLNDGTLSEYLQLMQQALEMTITNERGNPVLSIWYLIVLFLYSVIVPIILKPLPKPALFLVVIGFLLWAFTFPEAFYIERIAQYLVFFAIGGAVATYRSQVLPRVSAWYIPITLVFMLSCYLLLADEYALLICGIASTFAIHGLFMQKFWDRDRLFLFLGRNSMAIYLLNTIVIGLAQIAYVRYLPYQGNWFLIYSPLVFILAILLPVAVRHILGLDPRGSFLQRYFN